MNFSIFKRKIKPNVGIPPTITIFEIITNDKFKESTFTSRNGYIPVDSTTNSSARSGYLKRFDGRVSYNYGKIKEASLLGE